MKDCEHKWVPLKKKPSRIVKFINFLCGILGSSSQVDDFYCDKCYTVGSLDGFPVQYSTYSDIIPVDNQESYKEAIEDVKNGFKQ